MGRLSTDGWAERASRSHRLRSPPPRRPRNLQFCDRIVRDALALLHERYDLDPATDPRPRLARDILNAAFHCALDTWTACSNLIDTTALATDLRNAFTAVPGALAMPLEPHSAG